MYQGEIEVNKVYQESCLDTLKRLPDNCVDLIIADPPYQITAVLRQAGERASYDSFS